MCRWTGLESEWTICITPTVTAFPWVSTCSGVFLNKLAKPQVFLIDGVSYTRVLAVTGWRNLHLQRDTAIRRQRVVNCRQSSLARRSIVNRGGGFLA